MGLPASPWDEGSFASKCSIACKTIACANWPLESLHHIGTTVYFPTDLSIDTVLTANPYIDLLGPFYYTDVNVEPLHIRNNIYLLTLFVGIFLEQDLTPIEAWTCICSDIVDGFLEVDCLPIIDWLHVALTLKTGDDKSPLAMPRPTAPLADGYLLRHRHHMLARHLPGMDPAFQRVQGLLIATHIWDIAVAMGRGRETKALVCQLDAEKGVPDLLGSKLTYLLSLSQVANHEDLPPVWKELAGAPKHQHLMNLKRYLNAPDWRLSFHAPIVVTPGLLKLTISL